MTCLVRVILLAAAAAVLVPAWSADAQSPQGGTGEMPAAQHMMHDHGAPQHQAMPGMAPEGGQMHMSPGAEDPRQLVALPVPMQVHMLANMRDHLATLNEVIGDIADGKFDAASRLLEERLGMSSLSLHGAAQMAPYFPQPMQDAGTGMHRAASRLAIVLQDASVTQTFESMRAVNAALHEVTSSCIACHTAYRVR